MNRSQNWIVGAVVLIAAALVVVVMLWPQDKSKADPEGVRIEVVEPVDEPTVAHSLEALRHRARAADAGQIPAASGS